MVRYMGSFGGDTVPGYGRVIFVRLLWPLIVSLVQLPLLPCARCLPARASLLLLILTRRAF